MNAEATRTGRFQTVEKGSDRLRRGFTREYLPEKKVQTHLFFLLFSPQMIHVFARRILQYSSIAKNANSASLLGSLPACQKRI